MLGRVPNQPRYQVRGFRIPDDLWAEIERVAADNDETYTELVIRALWREVRRWPESN
jgi:hypothetical protein